MEACRDIEATLLHATTVSSDGAAVLILGRSGAGKSSLALCLMAMGAGLVADDRTAVADGPDGPVASCPAAIAGRIEARGVGILSAVPVAAAPIRLVVDLDETETERLPPRRVCRLAGHEVPLVYRAEGAHFAAAVMQHLRGGRVG